MNEVPVNNFLYNRKKPVLLILIVFILFGIATTAVIIMSASNQNLKKDNKNNSNSEKTQKGTLIIDKISTKPAEPNNTAGTTSSYQGNTVQASPTPSVPVPPVNKPELGTTDTTFTIDRERQFSFSAWNQDSSKTIAMEIENPDGVVVNKTNAESYGITYDTIDNWEVIYKILQPNIHIIGTWKARMTAPIGSDIQYVVVYYN